MSKFSRLKHNLGFREAVQLYVEMRRKKYRHVKMRGLQHPFTLRQNPYDYVSFEQVLLYEMYKLPPGTSARNIIDGGGNIGLAAIYFANKFPSAKIITVEPDAENFELLTANCRAYDHIVPLRGGIWSHSASLEVIDTGQGNNAFMVRETSQPVPGAVTAWGIEALMERENWETIDILKLDIEGSEKQVFEKNYENWLPKTKILFVEMHDRMVEGSSTAIFAAISRYRFSCEIAGENLLFINKSL